MKQTDARYSPQRLSDVLTGSVRAIGHDLRLAVQEGREAMLEREAELPASLHHSPR